MSLSISISICIFIYIYLSRVNAGHGSPTNRDECWPEEMCIVLNKWIVTPSLPPFGRGFLSYNCLTFSFCMYTLR